MWEFLTAILGFVVGYFIQKLRNRPQPLTHGCRVSNLEVYTYFDSKNNPSDPSCPHLSKDGSKKCNFKPLGASNRPIARLHKGKCYLALWGKKK